MKKKYLSPQIDINLIRLEENLLNSQRNAQSQDLEFDSEIDPWE